MGLFDFLKKKDTAADNKGMIGSPLKGECVELSQVNDPTFSSGILGSGVAVIPADGKICAPADGTVNIIFPTGHAVAMTTTDGVELLIHFGLDTVKLEGKHFNIVGTAGAAVKKGALLVEADVEAIKAEGYDVITPVLVSNTDAFASVEGFTGKEVNVGDEIIKVTK